MISFQTSRFGSLQVKEDKVISFPEGLLGFPEIRRYILMEYKDTPLKWLQAVDDPDVAFIVAEPSVVMSGNGVRITESEKRRIRLEREDELAVLVIVRVEGERVIANASGPLAINSRLMLGIQTVADRAN